MQSVQVLSNMLKSGSRLDNSAALPKKAFSGGAKNAAGAFSTLFGDLMNSNIDLKGQQSSKAGLNVADNYGNDPVSSVQNPNDMESMAGQGNFAFSIFTQTPLQSDLPAGKEANSGNGVSQESILTLANGSMGSLSSSAAGANWGLVLANLLSMVSDEAAVQSGTTEAQSQGGSPGISDLDKYKQLIDRLLAELSGEIAKGSSGGKNLSLEALRTGELSQETAKIMQGWLTARDENEKPAALTNQLTSQLASQKESKPLQVNSTADSNGGNRELKDGLEKLAAELNRVLDKDVKDTKETGIRQVLNGQLNAKGEGVAAESKPGIGEKAAAESKPGVGEKTAAESKPGVGEKTAAESKPGIGEKAVAKAKPGISEKAVADSKSGIGEKAAAESKSGIGERAAAESKSAVGERNAAELKQSLGESLPKVSKSQVAEASNVRSAQDQTIAGLSPGSNAVLNVAEGKSVASPVWEQLSNLMREQLMNRGQELRQLDLQLQPAELGKIQVAMRWENGQLHLQFHASEAATAQLLQNQLANLRQALVSQGVDCGMLQMGHNGEQQQNSQGDASRRTLQHNADFNEDNLAPVGLAFDQDENSLIDVTA